jgi:hypothetical protein
LKFSPPISNAFPLTKQNSPSINSPLSVQEGFDISILKCYFSPPFEHNKMPMLHLSIDNHTNWKTLFKIRWWWCGPFALGYYFLPLWHESPKTESLEPLDLLSPSLVINKWVKIIPKMEWCSEWQWRMSYGVEAFVFAEDFNSLSIYLWLGLRFTWKHISHGIWKRHDQRYMNELCVQINKRSS